MTDVVSDKICRVVDVARDEAADELPYLKTSMRSSSLRLDMASSPKN